MATHTFTSVKPPAIGTDDALSKRHWRIGSLAIAEFRQLVRNKTLLVFALVLPIFIPVGLLAMSREDGELSAVAVASALEIFVMYSLVFVVFYTLVSMVTTRRDERVLKRLRTGESSDLEIVISMSTPGAVLFSILTVLVVSSAFILGGPAPQTVVPLLVAFLLGMVIFIALAFATSTFTKNAEATQITSLPVVTIAALGMTNVRTMFPEGAVLEISSYTPMAAIADILHWSWAGVLPTGTEEAFGFTEVLAETIQPAAVLLGWAVLSIAIAAAYFRWDPRS